MGFISLVEASSTTSDIVMEGVVNTLKARDIDIKKVWFSCFDRTNSMSGIHNDVQWQLNRFILHEIQKVCGMKSLNVVKAAVTRWLFHGAACKRCRERYGMILGSLDKILTRNPRPELNGYHDEMLNAHTVLQITFLKDVPTITNILSLVLQSDRKDFRAVRCALSTTPTTLNDMQNISSVHLTRTRRREPEEGWFWWF